MSTRQGCICDKVKKGSPRVVGRDCPHCWHWWHTPAIRAARGGDPNDCVPVKSPVVRSLPCIYEGIVVEWCQTCGNKEGRHVRQCNHPTADRDKCTRTHVSDKIQSCEMCEDYPELPAVGRRHLAYFVLPVAGNGIWQRGIDQLRLRWGLFTGRKIFAVATGGPVALQYSGATATLDSIEAVRRYLPADAEVIEVKQDSRLWELAGWPQLWSKVLDGISDADVIMYAHAKGVTRPTTITTEFGATTQQWSELLYKFSLDYWPVVEEQLRSRPLVGAFKRTGSYYGANDAGRSPDMVASRWQYSGNFWWVRASMMRAKYPSVAVPVDPWGPEAWLGIAFGPDEAGEIGPKVDVPSLYEVEIWNKRVVPAAAKWIANNRPSGEITGPQQKPSEQPRLSIILATSGRDTLNRTIASITPQLLHGDELLIERDNTGIWGAAARTRAMGTASGDYLLFMDDDDVYLPDALTVVRKALAENPNRPHLFRMRYSDGYVLWKDKSVAFGNVSTHQIVIPNDPHRMGEWGLTYASDYDFIRSTLAKYLPDSVVWREEVISLVRPKETT